VGENMLIRDYTATQVAEQSVDGTIAGMLTDGRGTAMENV